MTAAPTVEQVERVQVAALLAKLKSGKLLAKTEMGLVKRVLADSAKPEHKDEQGDAPSHLTAEHQRRAASRPRVKLPNGAKLANPNESIEDATLRLQQAKADTEELDALKRQLELEILKGSLIPATDARDNLEAEHLRWVAELEQLPHSCASALPPEIAASVREVIRAEVERQCLAVRQRIANG